jgi:hypothetical protein
MTSVSALGLALILGQAGGVQIKSKVESREGWFTMKTAWPSFAETHPLQPLLNKAAQEPAREAESGFKEALQDFTEKPGILCELDVKPTISYNATNLVSILFDHYVNLAGPHPNSWTACINVGVVNGEVKRIKLGDLLVDGVSEQDVLEGFVRPRLSKLRRERVGEGLEALPVATHEMFVVSKNGLTFPFDRYTVGAYAEGDYLIKLKWSELKGMINRDMIPQAMPLGETK